MPQFEVVSYMVHKHGTPNTQQDNELLPNEMDFWSRSVTKSGEETARKDTICATMNVGKNM
jgi:hypothetical protein